MKSLIKVKFAALLILFFSLLMLPVVSFGYEGERINSFHSDIIINKDSSMKVTEIIKVTSTGTNIIHGIYRDFPTQYRDSKGNLFTVGFKVISVLRDGEKEPYSISNLDNGKRVKIGSANVIIPPGQYTFTITYTTYRQLGFFDNFDELFWNVTGNGWVFPIEEASASVSLPAAVDQAKSVLDGYTGPMGSTEKNLKYSVDSSGRAVYQTTAGLNSYEGLSILLQFPKGIINKPTGFQNFQYWLRDNISTVIIAFGAVIAFIFFITSWYKYGRDPKKGIIIPLYTPPENLSPEQIRYVKNIGYDNKVFTSAILNMAVKGYLRIEEEKKILRTVYTVVKTGKGEEVLSEQEKAAAAVMPEAVELKQENYRQVQNMMKVLKEKLEQWNNGAYFKTNSLQFFIGFGISLLFIIFAVTVFSDTVTPFVILPIVVLIIINLLFLIIMKAPTIKGRKLMDDIEGFKMFLSVTEKERLNLLNPPEKTPELFERYLPYALALNVEQKWAEQFSDVFRRIAASGQEYSPLWYSGSAWNIAHASAFASSFSSSFSHAISSSSTAPGSASGGAGGSGGGGGGGGGGGW